jgi:hypothetical protein
VDLISVGCDKKHRWTAFAAEATDDIKAAMEPAPAPKQAAGREVVPLSTSSVAILAQPLQFRLLIACGSALAT